MRRGLTDCLKRASLGALFATALMCVVSVSFASAQASEDGPAPPELPFISDEFGAPVAPPDVAPPASTTPSEAVSPAQPEALLPPAYADAPSLMGSRVGLLRRTLVVRMLCGAPGTVTVLRKGRRIGRRNFTCPANGVARVRVRITRTAARRLRHGTPVRVNVRTGAQRDSKRLRVVRTAPARAAANPCTDWYVSTRVATFWQAATSWWEFLCAYQGFRGGHLADWWDFYFLRSDGYQEYYGSWTRFHADGCWYYWHATNLSQYGPYCP
jgi:hypothetical protein